MQKNGLLFWFFLEIRATFPAGHLALCHLPWGPFSVSPTLPCLYLDSYHSLLNGPPPPAFCLPSRPAVARLTSLYLYI